MAEYPYPQFKHGAYGEVIADGVRLTANTGALMAFVYIGTSPVGQTEGGAGNVNKPILCKNMADARKALGYSDDWAKYTLCEAMHVHFELNGVGPVVFINVLDPTTMQTETGGSATLTPNNGRVFIAGCEDIYLDSMVVRRGQTTLVKGTDYTAAYDYARKGVVISEVTSGSLGTTALTISYAKVDPTAVTAATVIGTTDGYGANTGIQAVRNVYNVTGKVPAFLLAPGFASLPAVHTALAENSTQIGTHWNAWMFVDMPVITDGGVEITLATAPAWKKANGYTHDNESVYFPLIKGTDGKIYHMSTLAAANFQRLMIQNDGIPYMSASNTAIPIAEDLYFSANIVGRVYSDDIINKTLNCNGINSAAFVSGRWVLWGTYAGSYDQDDATSINVFDTCLMMLYYVTNDFQHRRNVQIDKPMPINDLKAIVAEEQARLDALLGIKALTYGQVRLDGSKEALSDVYEGGFRILFDVTNTPLAKHLTAIARWTDDGFEVYFQAMADQT